MTGAGRSGGARNDTSGGGADGRSGAALADRRLTTPRDSSGTSRPRDAFDLAGKRCIVTGATSGLGLALAEALCALGADVVGVGRDPDRCRAAQIEIRRRLPNAAITYEVCDLADQRAVKALGLRLVASPIDVLINNAGTFTVRRKENEMGIELQLAVNYLAAAALTVFCLSSIVHGGRVINVSSGSHYGARIRFRDPGLRFGYTGLSAYGQSKLAMVMFTHELARRLGPGAPIDVFAADPGLVNTAIGAKGTGRIVAAAWRMRARGGVDPAVAAADIAFLAADPALRGRSGRYWRERIAVEPSRRAWDLRACGRLWELTDRLTGGAIGSAIREHGGRECDADDHGSAVVWE